MADDHVRAEGAIGEVVNLLNEFRSTRGFSRRGRVAVQATRALSALTPGQRRQLAVDVASRAAPHLVDKIESETNLDLTPAQVRAVIEMVGNLDRHDVDSLLESVQDPEWQRRAAERAVGVADGAIADAGVDIGDAAVASLLTDPATDVLPDGADQEDDDGWFQDDDGNWYRYEDDVPGETAASADAVEPPADAEAPRPLAPVEPPDGPREPPVPQVVPTAVAGYAAGLPEMETWRATGVDASQLAFARRERAEPRMPAPPVRVADDVEQSWFGGGSLDIAPVAPVRTALGDRLREIERSAEQLRMFLAAADEFVALTPGEQTSVLCQMPATWVRRRAVLALINEGRLPATSARAAVRAFDSAVNRAWIVASLVEAGLATVAEFADDLTPAARARLERRYAA